jgi:hypothetical protein
MIDRLIKVGLFLVIYLLAVPIYSQHLSNRLDISASYNTNILLGDKTFTDGNFSYPGLYGNMEAEPGLSIDMVYKIPGMVAFGFEYDAFKFIGWKYQECTDYTGANGSIWRISPMVRIYSPWKESGFMNSFHVYFELAPVFGVSNLILINPVSNVESSESEFSPLLGSKNMYYGARESVGLEYDFNHYIGLGCFYSRGQNRVSSVLYNDTRFNLNQIGVKIYVRFFKDKRVFY